MKVLIIDDSNTIRRSAEIFLKQGGHEVMLAEDGFDALAKISDFHPDLIFCDILMPRRDLTKPFTKDQLLQTVRDFTGQAN